MHSRLVEILAEKQREVAKLKKSGIPVHGDSDLSRSNNFARAISVPNRIGLIAEIKFASPSAGTIRKRGDPISIGRVYEGAGAGAVSLVTDKRFFGGELGQLPPLKRAISLPILRKDFIIDEVQLREASIYGADAALLIVRILSSEQLKELTKVCREFDIAALVEVHDRADLEDALDCGADIIGINNRDLDSFEINPMTTLELAPLVPDDYVLVSESGIKDGSDMERLKGVTLRKQSFTAV